MTTYICGRMRGYARHNYPAFDSAAGRLKDHGHTVVSPADLSRESGITEFTPLTPSGLRACMSRDLWDICRLCDGMALLPGWAGGVGTRVEAALGLMLGVKFYDGKTVQEIPSWRVRLMLAVPRWCWNIGR